MKWLVRKAMESDLESLVRIDRLSHPVPWSAESWRDCIAGNNETVLLLVCRQTIPEAPVGMAAGRFLSGEFEVLNIAVAPSYRNRGLGRLLMEGLRQQALSQGCGTWILEVRESNQPARHLYGSLGFVETGKRSGYYPDTGEAAILMAGRLAGSLGE